MAYEPVYKSLRSLNDAYRFALRSGAPTVEQPPEIKIPLRTHQKAILYEMEQREQLLTHGMDVSGATLWSQFSFLGDGVGVGKSLMVLGHIARLKTLPAVLPIPILESNSTTQMYTLHTQVYDTALTEIGCLIVVPHTLYRQWQTYLKEQTTLKWVGIQSRRNLDPETAPTQLREADVVLVSNTLFGSLQELTNERKFFWKRVFFDEADTLHIPSTKKRPLARFTWLISASWANLLFPNQSIYATHTMFQTVMSSTNVFEPEIKTILQNSLTQSQHGTYSYLRYYMVSPQFFRELVHTNNPNRGRLVLRCSEAFVKESITLPPITIRNITCRPMLVQHIVSNAIPASVRTLLHAGDIQGALQELGVKTEEPMSLVQAVSENRLKELDRLRKTYDFKASLEYSTPQAKENALKSLQDKIGSLEAQIKQLRERIENYKEEMCPICFDEPQNPALTPCCSRIFCAGCILTSLTRKSACPLCRATIGASGLRSLATAPILKNEIVDPTDTTPQLLKKTEQLLQILQEKPDGKFLVFSRFDNPFLQLTTEIESLKITVKQVKGNKDVIASSLKSFQSGSTKVLLLNSMESGAGLNITAATDVILLHAMTHEEEKQILGRAYRLGRTEPLTVTKLLHPDELAHQHGQ